jgi:hypothetical protein
VFYFCFVNPGISLAMLLPLLIDLLAVGWCMDFLNTSCNGNKARIFVESLFISQIQPSLLLPFSNGPLCSAITPRHMDLKLVDNNFK